LKAHLRTKTGLITFEVEAANQKELFEQIADVQEVFDAETECRLCHSKTIRFQVRTVDDNKYYEMVCDCGGQFSFGQNKKGNTLFPKRDKGTHGWTKYEKGAPRTA
jgi:hypothetical protein